MFEVCDCSSQCLRFFILLNIFGVLTCIYLVQVDEGNKQKSIDVPEEDADGKENEVLPKLANYFLLNNIEYI